MPTDGFDGERRARLLAPPGVLLAAAGILVGGWAGPLLVAFGFALLVLAATSATEGVLLIGPFAQAELRAAARRGRVWRWRAVYVLLCGLTFYLSVFLPRHVATANRPLPPVSVFTQGFFLGVAGALASYLTHLTLSVVAPVAAEEREKKRWEMLLTTDLRNREVLFGKIAGRLPGLFEPLLACLPILAVLPFLGGVSPVLVGCTAVVTLSLIGGVGAVAAYCSVTQPTAEKALNQARGYLFGWLGATAGLIGCVGYPPAWTFPTSVGLTSPVELRHVVEWANAGNPLGAGILAFSLGVGRTASVEDDLVTLARRCAAFWAAAGGLLTLRAVARLRGDRLFAAPAAGTVGGKPKPVPRRPPVPDRAVAWWTEYGHLTAAQMRVIGGINGWSYVRWLLWSLAVLGGCRWWAHVYPDRWPFLGKLADIASPALLVMWAAIFVLVPLFLAAQVIAKERVADTLQSLTLTALSARDIVAQKWRGVLRPLRHTWVVGACWAVAAVATGGIPWWAALLFLTITPLVAPCWAAIGLGFSAHASTPAKAGRNLSAVVFGGGYGLGIVVSVLLSFIPDRTAKAVVGGGVAVLAVLAQPLLAWLAFRYAVRRLEREYD